MRVSVLGCTGKIGRLLVEIASREEGIEVAGMVSRTGNLADLFENSDAIIDFSDPIATEALLSFAVRNGKSVPIVVGTTGLSEPHAILVREYSNSAPIFVAPNMSYSVAVLKALVRVASGLVGEEYDVEILDVHHRSKKDAPSGTALMLAGSVACARNSNLEDISNCTDSRGQRVRTGEIRFTSQRCGNVPGIHEISFVGELDSLTLKHEVYSREIFARGALLVARWLVPREKGAYTMEDLADERIKSVLSAMLSS
jgi:4-hydroxy-tetrahydrodipicolinate reductase